MTNIVKTFIVSGFNRFNQLYSLHKISSEKSSEESNSPSSVSGNIAAPNSNNSIICEFCVMECNTFQTNCSILFSWSYSVIYYRDTLWLCGLINGRSSSVNTLKTPNNSTILQASCNRRQIVCVTEDGSCWQYNIETEEWKDLTALLHTEVINDETSRDTASKVCCGELVTAVLTSRGGVFNLPNKLSLPGAKIVDVACGRAHILMLSGSGEVFSVGEGSRGQLGHGELDAEEEPRLVEGLAGLTVVAIACGGWHSCAVTADGDLYTWGWNMCGQLGLQSAETGSGVSVQALPVVVDWPGQQDLKVCSVACGARHTVTQIEDGSVWGCGWNGYGQLALPGVDRVDHMTRLSVPQGYKVRYLQCGPWSTCLIT